MIKILVKSKCDWADEATLEGFAIFEPREWEYIYKEIEACQFPVEWYWGSNEFVLFESIDDVARCIEIFVLNSVETEIIEKRFIKFGGYGFTPFNCFEGKAPESFYEENGDLEEYIEKGKMSK